MLFAASCHLFQSFFYIWKSSLFSLYNLFSHLACLALDNFNIVTSSTVSGFLQALMF